MDSHDAQLSLDEFMVEMGRGPVSLLTHERLMDLTRRLRLSGELIASRIRFADDAYARNLVCRTPAFELLVLCWRPGQESTIHDHAGALNAISVHRGVLTSRVFATAAGRPAGAGPVELVAEEQVCAGGWTGVDREGIHQLANTTEGDLVTLHVYSPPLRELTVYATDSAETKRLRLRASLADDLA